MKFAAKSPFWAILLGSFLPSVQAADPVPYAPIAMTMPDSGLDQKVRDSATLKFGRVRVNQAGYRTIDVAASMAKFYYVSRSTPPTTFTVIDTAAHAAVGTGNLTDKGFKSSSSMTIVASNQAGCAACANGDTRYVMSSTGLGKTITSSETYEGTLPATLTAGRYYRVAVGIDTSVAFIVTDSLYGYVRDAVLKYFGIARSGDGPSWFHPPSHKKDGYLATPSSPGAYAGGWYDCGDHLKEPQTMSYALATLATLAATMPARDVNHYGLNHSNTVLTDGKPDILVEAQFGARFFLNSWLRHGKTTGPRGGSDTGMVTGVGDFGKDHGWWGRPESQDAMTELGRGGYLERTLRSELGANTLGDVAAGLAILSKRWRVYDAKFADSALAAAKDMYNYAKNHRVTVSSPAYNGAGGDKVNGNLALAATALLWATRDTMYLNDIAYNKTIGTHGATWNSGAGVQPMKNSWLGGWMVMSNPNLTKGGANTDWANRHAIALYAFYKLILANPDSALGYGVASETERQNLITHTIAGVIQNLSSIAGPSAGITIPLPSVDPNDGGGYAIKASSSWFVMLTQQEWVWNRYQMGNAAELFFYYDITRDLEAGLAGTELTGKTWNRAQVRQLMLRMMDYQLGDNPWDLSMIFGIGKKNFNHPHHRAANPEGRNTPGAIYGYHSPVGAIYGSWNPENSNDATAGGGVRDWNDYTHSEICLDGSATTLIPAVGLAMDEPLNIPPRATVKVLAALDTTADIEVDIDKYGTVVLSYGTTQGGPYTKVLRADTAGTIFKFHLSGLTLATQYFFNVYTKDIMGNDTTQDHWVNPAPDGTPYNFITMSQLQPDPNITGVKVCNVTSDSAEIMWYTPNGMYQSSICWGTVAPVASRTGGTTTCAMDIDASGHPTKFHYVKIGGLKEKTTYYFKVASDGSNGAWEDNSGKDYQFTTPVKMARFGIYAAQYDWGGMPALAINVVNREDWSYDSLSVRVYVRAQDTVRDATGKIVTHIQATATGLVNVPMLFKDAMAARYDICQAYNEAGFNKPCDDPVWGSWGNIPGTTTAATWATLNNGVQMLPPVKMPETYDPVTNTYVYYYDLPLGPTTMKGQSRIRFDVIFAARSEYSKNLNQNQLNLINWVKAFVPSVPQYQVGDTGWYDALASAFPYHPMGANTKDWSFVAHSTAAGAPVDFAGIPNVGTQSDASRLIDALSDSVPMDPYMTVYRKGQFIYGFSPSAVEQSTKRAYWGIKVALDTPFNVVGNNITLDKPGSLQRVTGVADVFDVLTPDAKGTVKDIWVNGVRLTPAELATAAVQDPVTHLWKLNIPLRLTQGGNDVDITIFGGSPTCPDTATTCVAGCAFVDYQYFIQYTKGKATKSVLSVQDALGAAVGPLVVPDSSFARIRVVDNDNNKVATAPDVVKVRLYDLRTGKVDSLVLTETGDSTGIFQTAVLPVVGAVAAAGQISVPFGDSVLVKYMDANDAEDSAQVYLYAKPVWPSLASGAIVAGCGYNAVSAKLDRALRHLATGSDTILSGRIVVKSSTGDSVIARNLTSGEILVGASGADLTIGLGATLPDGIVNGRLDVVIRTTLGLVVASSTQLVDSVGPWIDSAKIVENLVGTASDSVYFWASEPLATSTAWPFLVRRAGVAVPATAFAGATISVADALSNKYLVLLPAGALVAGDSLRLDPATQSDLYAIHAVDCPTMARPLGLIARSAPINRAWLVDSDGDSRADQIHVVFGKVVGARDLPDSIQVRFGAGDTVRSAVVSIAQATDSTLVANLTVAFPFGITAGKALDGSGTMVAWKGGAPSGTYSVADSVGPALLSAELRYGSTYDTVEMRFSEPVKRATGIGILQAQPALELWTNRLPDSISTTLWRLPVVPGRANPGDSVRPLPTQRWMELRSGIRVAANHPWIRLSGADRPPAGLWISDSDGDGLADEVAITYHKTVVARDVPDSIQVSFGLVTAFKTLTASMATLSDSTIRFHMLVPYAYGMTRGTGVSGAGTAVFWKNGTYTGPFTMADSVGPVLMSAAIRYGTGDDTLDLLFSEPVAATTGIGWLAAKPGTEVGTVGAPTAVSETRWLLPTLSGSVAPGDSVRPLPTEQWGEASTGRKPSINHPWIPVGGSERAPAYGYYRDSNGDGAVDQAVIVFQKAPRARPGMALLWPSFGGTDTAVVDSGSWTVDPAGSVATIAVGPFRRGVTSSANTDLGRWLSNGTFSFPMYDSVPPVLTLAKVHYASADGVPDTLRLRWSEPVNLPALTAPARHKPTGVEVPVATSEPLAVLADVDGLGAGYLLKLDTIQFRKGDSAAFLPSVVSDKLGNQVPLNTRWVPVTFGTRPVRVNFRIQNYMELPVAGSPHTDVPAQFWMRGRGDEIWMRPDSTAAIDTNGYVGVTITTNHPVGGAAYIYDNAGVFVASIDFTKIAELYEQNKLPMDESEMYQMKIVWDGRLPGGGMASSGVYVMRLLMKPIGQGEDTSDKIVNKVFKLGFKRPRK